ncbi:DMT family transporter [Pseudooceanicola pacificus]|nr:DMT family transporter [Pseudooceanicola pacificus]
MAGGLMVLSFLAGLMIAAQGPIYARTAAGLGGALPATLLAFSIATAALALLVAWRGPVPRAQALAELPAWVWPGGLIGVCVILVSIQAVPRLGAAGYLVLLVAGQMAGGMLWDRLGAFGLAARPVNWINLLGVALVLAGAVLAVWRRV